MKRLIPLLLLLLLLLAACGFENRQDTEDDIPTGSYYFPGSIDSASLPVDNPAVPQGKTAVKTVLSYAGEIPLTDPVRRYSYELPLIDLAGSHAVGCNQDIENFFGSLIRQSVDAMEHYEDPILERLSYSSFTTDGILTLRVDRRDLDGAENAAWYTVDAETGEAVSVEGLFSAAGIDGDPAAVLNEAVLNQFTTRYGALEGADVAHTTAWNRTQGALSPLTAGRMHLNENGTLTVAFELFAPDGGSSIVELILP